MACAAERETGFGMKANMMDVSGEVGASWCKQSAVVVPRTVRSGTLGALLGFAGLARLAERPLSEDCKRESSARDWQASTGLLGVLGGANQKVTALEAPRLSIVVGFWRRQMAQEEGGFWSVRAGSEQLRVSQVLEDPLCRRETANRVELSEF